MCQAKFFWEKMNVQTFFEHSQSRMNPDFSFGFMLETFSFFSVKRIAKIGRKKNPDLFCFSCVKLKKTFSEEKRES